MTFWHAVQANSFGRELVCRELVSAGFWIDNIDFSISIDYHLCNQAKNPRASSLSLVLDTNVGNQSSVHVAAAVDIEFSQGVSHLSDDSKQIFIVFTSPNFFLV